MTVTKFSTALVAVLGVANAHFRSGSVSSYEKFTYGKFVTRMKAPDKAGTVSSFFTYWDGPDFRASEWNELDIEIVPSVAHNPFSMNIIYGDGEDKKESHQYAHAFNPHDDWHTYAMEWTPEYISWSVDGHEVRHVVNDDPAVEHMAKEQSLRMNFWTPTFHSWGRGLDAKDMPWYLLYDYVEVFEYNMETNEFELHWRDDFETFDSTRWHKASGTFDANSSVFYPENVSVKAGNLVLKMEPEPEHVEAHLEKEHVIAHAIDEHLSDVVDHSHHRERLHRGEHFDREHYRDHRHSHAHDERFWIENKEADSIHLDVEHDGHHEIDVDRDHHHVYRHGHEYLEEDSDDTDSDSEAEWVEYQTYLKEHRRRHQPVEAVQVEVVEEPVKKAPVHETEVYGGDYEDLTDEEEYYREQKRAYKLWKDKRKRELKEEQMAHAQPHHRPVHGIDHYASDEEEDLHSYLSYKQRKFEMKQEERRAKQELKREKLRRHHEASDEHYRHDYDVEEAHHHPVRHHYREERSDREYSEDRQAYKEERHLDYRRWKYDEELPEKERRVADKQRDADQKFEEFRIRHAYMSEEELQLYHKHYEVEPFFVSKADRDTWRFNRKQEKLWREERRRVLKHEREARELEEAYERIARRDFQGDSDLDHEIQHEHELARYEHERPIHHEYRHRSVSSDRSDRRHKDWSDDSDSDSRSAKSDKSRDSDYERYLVHRRRVYRSPSPQKRVSSPEPKKPVAEPAPVKAPEPAKKPAPKKVEEPTYVERHHYTEVEHHPRAEYHPVYEHEHIVHKPVEHVSHHEEVVVPVHAHVEHTPSHHYGSHHAVVAHDDQHYMAFDQEVDAPVHHSVPVHHQTPVYHEAPVHHAAPVVHETRVHHEVPVHHVSPVVHETAVHHETQIHHETPVHHEAQKSDGHLYERDYYIDSEETPFEAYHHYGHSGEELSHNYEFRSYHVSHPELDHAYDDQHDVEPKHFHEHAVHHSFENKEEEVNDYRLGEGHVYEPRYHGHYSEHGRDVTPYEHGYGRYEDHEREVEYQSHHVTHPELDHAYDDAHDVEPRHFHEHAVHRSERADNSEFVREETPYEHGYGRYEDHDREVEYQSHHVTHPELDHAYDDQHDVEAKHFHEHAIHHAFDSADARSYGHGHHYNNQEVKENYGDYGYESHHVTHPELDHAYDDAHDVEPVHYHEHAVHHSFDNAEHVKDETPYEHEHYYEQHEALKGHHVVYPEHHDSSSYYHYSHPELDHEFDDQHDVEPKHFHEHAVHHAFEHPDSHSYLRTREIELQHEKERHLHGHDIYGHNDHYGERERHGFEGDHMSRELSYIVDDDGHVRFEEHYPYGFLQ